MSVENSKRSSIQSDKSKAINHVRIWVLVRSTSAVILDLEFKRMSTVNRHKMKKHATSSGAPVENVAENSFNRRRDSGRSRNEKGTHTISTRRWSLSQIVARLPTKHCPTDLSNWIRLALPLGTWPFPVSLATRHCIATTKRTRADWMPGAECIPNAEWMERSILF